MFDGGKGNDGTDILDAIRSTDPVRRLLSERADATAAERQALLDQLAAVDVEAEAETPRLVAALERAGDGVRAAQDKLAAATKLLSAAASARLAASFSFDRRRTELTQALRAGADNDQVDKFRSWLLDAFDAARKIPIETITIGALKNEITGKRQAASVVTNSASIASRLAAIRDALAGLDDLRLLADQRQLAARIATIKAALPGIEPPRAPRPAEEASNEI